MERIEPRYTKTADGTHVAYSVMGEGAIDVVYAFGYHSSIDADGDVPFHAAFRRRLSSFARLILFDRRGTGLSDRSGLEDTNALEAGMDDIRAVMDVVGSERALLFAVSDGGLLSVLFAASTPNPIDVPSGCRFHPRCPVAEDRCRVIDPELVETSEGHHGACVLVGSGSEPPA